GDCLMFACAAARCWASCLAAAVVAALALPDVLLRLRAGAAEAAGSTAMVVATALGKSSSKSMTGGFAAAARLLVSAATLKASLATRAARLVGAGGSGISVSVLVFRAVKNTKPLGAGPSGFGRE